MLLFVICVVGSLLSIVSTTEFKPCNSEVPAPTLMTMTGCDTSPCTFKKGNTYVFAMEFTADDDHAEVHLGMVAVYMGMAKGYPGFDGKPMCNNIYSMPDKATVPLKYFLKDKKSKKDVVCSAFQLALSS